MVSYASHVDHVDSAFRELTQLSNEFYIIPRSEFPFRCFKHHEIWNEFGISPKESFFDFKRLGSTKGEWKTSPDGTLLIIVLTQGNYLAAHILRGLRTGSVKPIRVRDHNLARLLDLPYDIILEVRVSYEPDDRTLHFTRSLATCIRSTCTRSSERQSLFETSFYRGEV